MKIWSHSATDRCGREFITIEVEPFEHTFRQHEFEHTADGGLYVVFDINHKRKQTEARWMFYYMSTPQIGGRIKTWDGIWTEEMCLKYCEENYGRMK